ncbi:MAG: hypothetical protein SOX97_04750 [Sutterella sp.]|nr:hypothetical protein [Sutterella sp.]
MSGIARMPVPKSAAKPAALKREIADAAIISFFKKDIEWPSSGVIRKKNPRLFPADRPRCCVGGVNPLYQL